MTSLAAASADDGRKETMSKNNRDAWKQINDLAKQNKVVEITPTVESSGQWQPSLSSADVYDRAIYVDNHDNQARVDVTVHSSDGRRQTRSKSLGSYPGEPKEARRAAQAEAERLAKAARRKGASVIVNNGAVPSVEPLTESWGMGSDAEGWKSGLLAVVVFLVACVAAGFVIYHLAQTMGAI